MRGDFIGSFAQGARLGAAITGLIILAVVLGAVATLRGESSAPGVPTFPIPPAAREVQPPTHYAHMVDSGLLEAARARERAVREMVFELGRTEHTSETSRASAAAPVAAPPAAPPAPAATVRPPLVAESSQLYALLQEVFPAQADRAYGIVMCESSGNVTANTGNGYYGLWQFDLATWRSVGGAGFPSDASIEEQVRRARMLYDARGWSPWGCA